MALRNAGTITSTVKNGEEIFRHPPPRITKRRDASAEAHGMPMRGAPALAIGCFTVTGDHPSPLLVEDVSRR
jgi:hypothetical protein